MSEVFVKMASHLPSVKTFECEINSLSKHLRKLDYRLLVEDIGLKNNELKFEFKPKDNHVDKLLQDEEIQVTVTGTDKVELVSPELLGKTVTEIALILFKMSNEAIEQKMFYGRERITVSKVQDGRLILNLEKMKEKKTNGQAKQDNLLLIDGANLLSRGYFATSFRGKLMQNQEGLYTNGVYVFIKKLLKLIQTFKTSYVVVCWDVSRSETFRRQIYPMYKGLREETEPELKQQFETTEEALRMMNIPQLKVHPFEADDLIGGLSKRWLQAKDKGHCYIYSSDKDLFQLLDQEERIIQVISKNKEDTRFTWSSFENEYGIKPTQWTDVKAILGETGKSSDNIPGCKGVGEKAALPLIQQYETLDGIYENLENLDQKFQRYRNKLEQGKEEVELSKKLVTIVRDMPEIPDSFEMFKLKVNRSGIAETFNWLNINIKI